MPLKDSSEQSIANALIYRTREDLPLNEPEIAARHYLDLTAVQVQAAFQKYLRVKDLVQVTEGPAPKIE